MIPDWDEPDNGSKLNNLWKSFNTWYDSKKEGLTVFIKKTGNKITELFFSFRRKF